MKKATLSFSLENVLVLIAILMILMASLAPRFAKGQAQSRSVGHSAQASSQVPSR